MVEFGTRMHIIQNIPSEDKKARILMYVKEAVFTRVNQLKWSRPSNILLSICATTRLRYSRYNIAGDTLIIVLECKPSFCFCRLWSTNYLPPGKIGKFIYRNTKNLWNTWNEKSYPDRTAALNKEKQQNIIFAVPFKSISVYEPYLSIYLCERFTAWWRIWLRDFENMFVQF